MIKVKKSESKIYQSINQIPESFCYLFVGAWLGGDMFCDRKNVALLVKAFMETFKNKKEKPALILKTSIVGASIMDRDEVLKRIKAIKNTVSSLDVPNVYLLHGEFTDTEMNELYNHPKVKAMVSLTFGEGFGRPLLEFTQTKKPILTTGWSGHVDFLKSEFVTLLPGTLTNVHPSVANNMLIKEGKWFSPDHGKVGYYLKDIYENYKNYVDGGKREAYFAKQNFSYIKMVDKLNEYLKLVPELPKQTQLKLPELKKISLPSLKKI